MKRGLHHLQILLIIVICKLNQLLEMGLKLQHQLVHPGLKQTEIVAVQVTVWKFQDFSITQFYVKSKLAKLESQNLPF